MMEMVSLTLASSKMKFAAGHFTLFSATERENIHGHNFTVTVKIKAPLQRDGLTFDYAELKNIFGGYCQLLDEKLLLPAHSPYLRLEQQDIYLAAYFSQETLLFLPRDIHILPIANVSVENLASYFLDQLRAEQLFLNKNPLAKIKVTVASSPAQSGTACWDAVSVSNK